MAPKKKHTVVSVLIADDHALISKGLRDLLEAEGGFTVNSDAANGQEALAGIERLTPDIAILDIDMPLMNGLDVASAVQQKEIRTRLIALSMHTEEKIFDKAMGVGFSGYILKDGAIADIVAAIRAVLAGKYYISPVLSTFTLSRKGDRNTPASLKAAAMLSQAERKVLRLIAENKSTKEIAEQLFVSPRTIDSHRTNIAAKLELKGPNALLRFAIENKEVL